MFFLFTLISVRKYLAKVSIIRCNSHSQGENETECKRIDIATQRLSTYDAVGITSLSGCMAHACFDVASTWLTQAPPINFCSLKSSSLVVHSHCPV